MDSFTLSADLLQTEHNGRQAAEQAELQVPHARSLSQPAPPLLWRKLARYPLPSACWAGLVLRVHRLQLRAPAVIEPELRRVGDERQADLAAGFSLPAGSLGAATVGC